MSEGTKFEWLCPYCRGKASTYSINGADHSEEVITCWHLYCKKRYVVDLRIIKTQSITISKLENPEIPESAKKGHEE